MTIGTLIRLIMGIAGTVAVRAAVQVGAREAVKYGLKSQREKKRRKRTEIIKKMSIFRNIKSLI